MHLSCDTSGVVGPWGEEKAVAQLVWRLLGVYWSLSKSSPLAQGSLLWLVSGTLHFWEMGWVTWKGEEEEEGSCPRKVSMIDPSLVQGDRRSLCQAHTLQPCRDHVALLPPGSAGPAWGIQSWRVPTIYLLPHACPPGLFWYLPCHCSLGTTTSACMSWKYSHCQPHTSLLLSLKIWVLPSLGWQTASQNIIHTAHRATPFSSAHC